MKNKNAQSSLVKILKGFACLVGLVIPEIALKPHYLISFQCLPGYSEMQR